MNNKILIVDDSAIIRERLASGLKIINKDLTILHADSVISATKVFQEMQPWVVILDIQLPDGNGIDLIPKIKSVNKGAIIVMLTNYPYSILKRRSLELGADYFFDKSIEFEKIFDVISKIK